MRSLDLTFMRKFLSAWLVLAALILSGCNGEAPTESKKGASATNPAVPVGGGGGGYVPPPPTPTSAPPTFDYPNNMKVTYNHDTKYVKVSWDQVSNQFMMARIVIQNSVPATIHDIQILNGGAVNVSGTFVDGQTYNWEVFVIDENSVQHPSSVTGSITAVTSGPAGTPPPTVPGDMNWAYNSSTDSAVITWTDPVGPLLSANIEVRDLSSTLIYQGDVLNGGSVDLSGLVTATTNYTYSIFVTDLSTTLKSTTGLNGGFISGVGGPSPPALPGALALSYDGPIDLATVTWTAGPTVMSFVEVRDGSSNVVLTGNTINGGSLDFNGKVSPSTTYNYKIWVIDTTTGLQSSTFSSGSFTTDPPSGATPPSLPAALAGTYNGASKLFSVDWTNPGFELLSRVKINKQSDGAFVVDEYTTKAGSIDLAGKVQELTVYDFKIWVYHPIDGLESTTFISGQFTTPADPVFTGAPFPSNMVLTFDQNTNFMGITWANVPGYTLIARMEVYDSTNSLIFNNFIAKDTSTDLSTYVSPGKEYSYRVYSKDVVAGDESGNYLVGGFETAPDASLDPKPVTPDLSDITVNELASISQSAICKKYDAGGNLVLDPTATVVLKQAPSYVYTNGPSQIVVAPTADLLDHVTGSTTITITYNCAASVFMGTEKTFDITINDTDVNPVFASEPSDLTVEEGATVSTSVISCTDEDAEDTPVITDTTGGLPAWITFNTNKFDINPNYAVLGFDANGNPIPSVTNTVTYDCTSNGKTVSGSVDITVTNKYYTIIYTGANEWDGQRLFYEDPGANHTAKTFTRDCYNNVVGPAVNPVNADQTINLSASSLVTLGTPSLGLNFPASPGKNEGDTLVDGVDYTATCAPAGALTAVKAMSGDSGFIDYTRIQNCDYSGTGAGVITGSVTMECHYYDGTSLCGSTTNSQTFEIHNKGHLEVYAVSASMNSGEDNITVTGAPDSPDNPVSPTFTISTDKPTLYNNVNGYDGTSHNYVQATNAIADFGDNTEITLTFEDQCGNKASLPPLDLSKNFKDPEVKEIYSSGRALHTCVITSENKVKCWGYNSFGQLGLGDTNNRGDWAGESGLDLEYVELGTGRYATKLALGNEFTCALLDNGDVKCWGKNSNGQLGLDNTAHRGDGPNEMGDFLPAVNLGEPATDIIAADLHACALLASGAMKCWGYNGYGNLGRDSVVQLGDGAGEMATITSITPSLNLGGATIEEMAVNQNSTCIRDSSGRVKCWGRNNWGQLGRGNATTYGDGAGEMAALPFVDLGTDPATSNPYTATMLRGGGHHFCALLNTGDMKCWGRNDYGQLGVGDAGSRGDAVNEMGDDLPFTDVGLPAGVTITDIRPGNIETCALLSNGTVKCWGYNAYGNHGREDTWQRGDALNEMGTSLPIAMLGNYQGTSVPLRVSRLATGIYHVCALIDNGQVKCWGRNDYGQLGHQGTTQTGDGVGEMGDNLRYTRITDKNLMVVSKLAKSGASTTYHQCVIMSNKDMKCWGHNNNGELGYGDTTLGRGWSTNTMNDKLLPIDLGLDSAVEWPVDAYVGNATTCMRTNLNRIKCWGYNGYGNLGYGDTLNRGDNPGEMGQSLPFIDLGAGRTVTDLTIGTHHICAILDNGKVKCWGRNDYGQLGQENTTQRGDNSNEMGDNLAYTELGTGRTAVSIEAGDQFTCAVLDNGRVKCWGYNQYGRLGQGNTTNRGDNAGEMGDGLAYTDLNLLTDGRTVTQLTAGYHYMCALMSDGYVKCWGYNGNGELGVGDTANRGDGAGEMGSFLPVIDFGQPTTGNKVIEISAGDNSWCARFDNLKIKCVGYNNGTYSPLGYEDTNNRGDSPADMGLNLTDINLGTNPATGLPWNVLQVEHFWYAKCAILESGNVKCWGANRRHNGTSWVNPYGVCGQEWSSNGNIGNDPGEMGNELHITPLGTVFKPFRYVAP